jgi:hypothetical protein
MRIIAGRLPIAPKGLFGCDFMAGRMRDAGVPQTVAFIDSDELPSIQDRVAGPHGRGDIGRLVRRSRLRVESKSIIGSKWIDKPPRRSSCAIFEKSSR